MTPHERTANLLKAVRFDRPDWIPARVTLLPSAWKRYGEAFVAVGAGPW